MTTPAPHQADTHNFIKVLGARENNLQNASVKIPKRRLTVFTGVSGSGKSSLVFGVIAAESQRLINETYSAFLQGFMPAQPQPDVDLLDGLTAAILVDQERMGANPRSTVGTATDANSMLRVLFSKLGDPHIGSPNAFSFNVATVEAHGAIKVAKGANAKAVRKDYSVAGGMCPLCEGRGHITDIDLDELYDKSMSVASGPFKIPGYNPDGWHVKIFANSGFFDAEKPIEKFTKKELDAFLYKEPTKVKHEGMNITYEGLIPRIQKSILSKDKDAMQPHIRAFVDRAVVFKTCPDCDGTRLNTAARSSKILGKSIADVCAIQISDLHDWLAKVPKSGVEPLIEKLQELVSAFVEIGLGYLSLDRPAGTLSGGEAQRTKMVRHLNSALTDATYIFDEPTAGLHPHDIQKMNELLLQLRDKGNTVLVVEHKPEVIKIADHVIDLGPGAGKHGGQIQFAGTFADLKASDTLTGRHLDDRVALKTELREPTGQLEIRGASLNNLQNVDVDIPLGMLVTVTGVAGSGKSSLLTSVAGDEDVVMIDQAPIKGSRRSNPATYTGLLDPIRRAFAKANGVKPGLFSSNSEGACPVCRGAGVIFTDLGMMATVSTPCEECEGQRFQAEVLEYLLGDKNIHQVLTMAVDEALEYFSAPETKVPAAAKILGRLSDVGLGYVTLGQPLNTLSGGERQRLKLAMHIGEPASTFILDEPTTGLHLADIEQLLQMLDMLIDNGKSIVVIEHHQAVMAHSDWIIDLGPGAGHDGGRVVFAGRPADLIAGDTLTGQHLKQYVAGT